MRLRVSRWWPSKGRRRTPRPIKRRFKQMGRQQLCVGVCVCVQMYCPFCMQTIYSWLFEIECGVLCWGLKLPLVKITHYFCMEFKISSFTNLAFYFAMRGLFFIYSVSNSLIYHRHKQRLASSFFNSNCVFYVQECIVIQCTVDFWETGPEHKNRQQIDISSRPLFYNEFAL